MNEYIKSINKGIIAGLAFTFTVIGVVYAANIDNFSAGLSTSTNDTISAAFFQNVSNALEKDRGYIVGISELSTHHTGCNSVSPANFWDLAECNSACDGRCKSIAGSAWGTAVQWSSKAHFEASHPADPLPEDSITCGCSGLY